MSYIVLTLLTVLSFIIFAKNAHKAKSTLELFKFAIISIILYSITYGFRKGWAIDYHVYDPLYTASYKLDIEQYEPLFRWIIVFLRFCFDSSAALFTLVAIVFISSVIYLFHDKKPLILYAIPIIYFFSAYQAANLVRYFLAMSFVYIGMEFLLDKKYIHFAILSLIGGFIHYSMVILLPIIFIIYYYGGFKKKWLNLVFYILTAIVSISSIQDIFVSPLSTMLSFIDFGDNQLAKYADTNALKTVLLGTNWDVSASIMYQVFTYAYAIIYLIFGAKVIGSRAYNGKLDFYYQLGALGLILQNIATNAEIINRISLFFVYPSLLVTAFIMMKRKQYFRNILVYMLFMLSIVYTGYHNIKGLYEIYDVEYIWDK